MRFYILFLIVISSSSITPSRAGASGGVLDPNKKVTKEYITRICSKSSDRNLCYDLLKDLIGSPVSKVTLETLGMRPMNRATAIARDTHRMIQGMQNNLINPTREVRERYTKCMSEYSIIMKNLGDARGLLLQNGSKNVVKSYVTSAMGRVKYCDKYFAKPPRIPLELKNANQKLRDLCSVIISICNKI